MERINFSQLAIYTAIVSVICKQFEDLERRFHHIFSCDMNAGDSQDAIILVARRNTSILPFKISSYNCFHLRLKCTKPLFLTRRFWYLSFLTVRAEIKALDIKHKAKFAQKKPALNKNKKSLLSWVNTFYSTCTVTMLTTDVTRTKVLFLSLWTGALRFVYYWALLAIEWVS